MSCNWNTTLNSFDVNSQTSQLPYHPDQFWVMYKGKGRLKNCRRRGNFTATAVFWVVALVPTEDSYKVFFRGSGDFTHPIGLTETVVLGTVLYHTRNGGDVSLYCI